MAKCDTSKNKKILSRIILITLLIFPGIAFGKKGHTTPEGFDIVFGTNYFGHYLLTMLLIQRLKECAPSRIVTLSSVDHKGDPVRYVFTMIMSMGSALLSSVKTNIRQ